MIIFDTFISMAIFWLALAVVFLIIEALTVGLTTIWFAAGSFVALILSLFDAPVLAQFIVFLVVSFCLLLFTRKIFVEKLRTGKVLRTNVDALIGATGIVTEDIRPFETGQVKLKGQDWTAVSKDPEITVSRDTVVKVIAIEGVKLIVSPEEQKG
ncbi:MAG: NfeD family protein [Anaerovoracaceae bacterium]|nr:NfeD family protein [Anaerovoracaceae bacterium]